MDNFTATISCINPQCQAVNSASHQFCGHCYLPLLKRYLWAMGNALQDFPNGSLIAERYQVIRSSLVLDTKPSHPHQQTQNIPRKIQPYLKLIPYRLHVPQIYGKVTIERDRQEVEVWLLEYGLLRRSPEQLTKGEFFPTLTQSWSKANSLRQLNWLWQMAQLLAPLTQQRVGASLLRPALLRVNGSVLQLLELVPDSPEMDMSTHLRQLGELWLSWVTTAASEIQPWLQQTAHQLSQGQLTQPDVLITELNKALATWGKEPYSYSYATATRTDRGRTRQHNEDACYPADGSASQTTDQEALAIVCDGIGGHDGGEVASSMAIKAIAEGVSRLLSESTPRSPDAITTDLENLTCTANDAISQRNDHEQRSDRQRMGTTLAMAVTQEREIYITHVGDSRVYWVTRSGCYQLTLDDDLAVREVRLGYALYREAIGYAGAGALVQALGMNSSQSLYPHVQRLILDEDSVFLLCSDGLSDFDRVEQYWESMLLPILDQKVAVKTVAEQLIDLANTKNGHDNVTVALIYTQVESPTAERLTAVDSSPKETSATAPTTSAPTMQLATPATRNRSRSFLIILLVLLGVGIGFGIYAYFFTEIEHELLPRRRESVAPPDSAIGG